MTIEPPEGFIKVTQKEFLRRLNAAAAILRTSRPLSSEFREQAAQMVEALDECMSNLSMTELAHRRADQPFYCKGLEMGRAALSVPAPPPED